MIVHRKFTGGDRSAFEDFARALSPELTVQSLAGDLPFFADSYLGVIGDLKIWRNRYGQGISTATPNTDDRLVVLALSSGAVYAPGLVSEPVGMGRIFTAFDQHLDRVDHYDGTSFDGMFIPTLRLSNRLAKRLDRPLTKPLQFGATHDATTGAAASIPLVLSGLLATLANPLSVRDGATLKSLSVTLVDLVLEALPHNYTQALEAPASRIAPRQVKRALAYIHDKPMPVLTVDELAVVCGVSARSLQYAFRDFVGVAPSDYWRRVRLEKSIDQLRRQPSSRVSEVCNAWGFTNVTRFCALCAAAGADDIVRRASRALRHT